MFKSEIVYKNGSVTLTETDTERGLRVLLSLGKNAVLVIPTDKNGNYLLVKQQRPGSEQELTLEFPSGGIEENETPEEAARREMLEEIGDAGTLEYISSTEPLSGVVGFKVHIFKATNVILGLEKTIADPAEKIECLSMTLQDIHSHMQSSSIVDGYLLIGLGAHLLSNKNI